MTQKPTHPKPDPSPLAVAPPVEIPEEQEPLEVEQLEGRQGDDEPVEKPE